MVPLQLFILAYNLENFLHRLGLTAMGQGVIIAVKGKEGWARPYQELIWEVPN